MIPKREIATHNGQTYFVTSNTAGRRPFFRHERWTNLFLDTLYSYRPERYLLHAFVLMPDHFHALITPQGSLERAVQCLKGGFSFRVKKELGWVHTVWVAGFSDHRIRNDEDFAVHLGYIHGNPVKARLVENADEYVYGSASGRFDLDAFPQGLKPKFEVVADGAAKAAPFQSEGTEPFQSESAAPLQSKRNTLSFRDEGDMARVLASGAIAPAQHSNENFEK